MSTVISMSARAPLTLVAWDAPDPEAAFERLRGRRGLFWLDSSRRGPGGGRYSVMGCEPFSVFRSRGSEWSVERQGCPTERGRGDPLGELERMLLVYQVDGDAEGPVPFRCGAVGYLGYGFGAQVEPAGGGEPAGPLDPPDAHWAWHDAAAVWDHGSGRAWLVGAGWRRPPAAAIAELAGWLAGAGSPPAVPPPPAGEFQSDFTREGFLEAVGSVRERIAAGEIYQMNLAQRFSGPLSEDPAQLYRRLRRLNPSPMSAYLDAGDCAVLSSSPERFLSLSNKRIRTFPIKGTRPRGETAEEDARLRRELVASAKERAELLMIVDLLRNDLGRVSRFGSVRVRRLHDLETFATVHHLVGEVEGEVLPGVGPSALLRAVFPGGSITGAPKIRARRIISEVEPVPRGVFSGSIGYWSACGRVDLNIAIRTIVCHGGRASFHVGAGIVWDSDPASEFAETLAKGRALLAALGGRPWPGEARR
jgi:para-aminobenzoate synthetase component 1